MSTAAGTETASVTLTVTGLTASTITLNTSALTFNAVAGGAAPPSLTVGVTAPTYTNAIAQVSEQSCTNNSWLSVSPSTTFLAGPTSTNLVVSVNQSGLTIVGTTCTGLITVSAPSGTQTVLVTMTIISAPTSVLTVSPSSLTFNAVAGASGSGFPDARSDRVL